MYLHINPEEIKSDPMVNDATAISVVSYPYGRIPPVNHTTLWDYFKKSPEIVALTSCIVEDILSDGWWLEGGRNNVKKAEEFLARNNSKQLFSSFLYDVLVTGDGYLYKVKPSELEMKSIIGQVIKSNHQDEIKTLGEEFLFNEIKSELVASKEYNNVFQTRDIRLLASSTMKIDYDSHGVIKQYIQHVAKEFAYFPPEEVLHFTFTNINGEFYGFTPLSTVFDVLDMIHNVKDFEKNLFDKGGVPPFMFVFENETPNSPTMKLFKKQLLTYATMNMKWKSMALTGKVDIKELNNIKDMQFAETIRFATQVLVMAWGVPSSRLSDFLISKGVKGSDSGTAGYYRKISHYQDLFEDMINSQLLYEFDVIMHFNRTYKEDEVREVQIEMFNVDALTKKQSLLAPYNKRLKQEVLVREMNLKDDDVEEGTSQMEVPGQRQGQLNNATLLSQSENKLADNKVKQRINLEAKSLMFDVSWDIFLEQVRHSKVPEVYYEIKDSKYIFYHQMTRSTINAPVKEIEKIKLFKIFDGKQLIQVEGAFNG
jgi:hypothetical protein